MMERLTRSIDRSIVGKIPCSTLMVHIVLPLRYVLYKDGENKAPRNGGA
jgi:hypothetical protein|uniref:Uncharacterized protein n=1 Tax=Picea glauca TaxID=3330 RepID=A0A117NH26_PICGL|nr:hypothetical protein ABT39_MTgene5910 [Picea glauca]QHR92058.1 hypothetical protein Q903MT_gene6094 [Picea sitchensis]